MKPDEPILFYLRHQTQIDEWCALRSRASVFANEFLAAIAPPLAERMRSVDSEAEVLALRREGSYPKVFVVHPKWLKAPPNQATWKNVRAAIGIEWYRDVVQITGTGTDEGVRAYAGVWHNREESGAADLRDKLLERLGDDSKMTRGPWFLRYRYEPPRATPVWDHLDEYREQLIDSIVDHWRRYSAVVDQAIIETASR